LLGCFLFSGDDVEKKIKVLSGGEKARVALAKTIVSKANFLMLDEPTNHLDMHSCDLLIEALNKYEGSFILVSHDRYFISKTANKIWEIENHQIKEFKGTYEEWVEWKERMAERSMTEDKKTVTEKKEQIADVKPVINQLSTAGDHKSSVNKEAKKELQKQQRIFQQLEEKIAMLTKQKGDLEKLLTEPAVYSDKNKFLETEKDHAKTAQELSALNKQYEEAFEKIMQLENSK
jgi:ATP-binding cassette subfamily F protein 3